MVLIRRATLEDAGVVSAMTEEVYVAGGWADPQRSPDYVRSLLDAPTRIRRATVLLALLDTLPVGTITATQGPPLANIAREGELEIRMLGVLPPARRKGVALALVARCEQLARDRGLQAVVLSTEPGMTDARRLYERLGYRRTPGRDWVINDSALITYRRDV